MSTNLNRKVRVVFDEITRIFCKTQQKEFNGKVVPLHLDFVTLFKMLKGKNVSLQWQLRVDGNITHYQIMVAAVAPHTKQQPNCYRE